MAIKVMADSGGTITYTASEIGGAFNTFAGNNDYVISGIGNEMALTYSAGSLQVSIASGRAVVCGRPVTVDATETLVLGASESNILVVLRVDTTRPIGSEGYFTYCTEAQLKTENINNANGQHDLVIAKVSTDASGVTSYSDQRNVVAATGGAKYRITKDKDGNPLAEPLVFELVGIANKQGVVEYTNGVLMDAGSLRVGIDTTNVIASKSSTGDLTLAEDGYAVFEVWGQHQSSGPAQIDGRTIAYTYATDSKTYTQLPGVLVKKGSVIHIQVNDSAYKSAVTVYGFK